MIAGMRSGAALKPSKAVSLRNGGGPGGRSEADQGDLDHRPHRRSLRSKGWRSRPRQPWNRRPSHHILGNVPGVSVGNETSQVQPNVQDFTSHPWSTDTLTIF